MIFVALKTLHIISVLILFGCLFSELLLIKKQLTRKRIKLLSIIDGAYVLSSVFILSSGFYIALNLGKGRDFYFENPAIYIKLVLFILVGLLSIYPTVFFLKNRKGTPEEIIARPDALNKIIFLEILLVICIPFFAVILANGISL